MNITKIIVTLTISTIFIANSALATTITPYRTLDRDNMSMKDATLEYMFLYGMELYNTGHYKKASKVFARILELDPQYPEARKNLEKIAPKHPSLVQPVKYEDNLKTTQMVEKTQNTFETNKKTTITQKVAKKSVKPFNNDYKIEKIEPYRSTIVEESVLDNSEKIQELKRKEQNLLNQSSRLESNINNLKSKLANNDEIHTQRVRQLEQIIAQGEREIERLNGELVKQDDLIAKLKDIAAAHEAEAQKRDTSIREHQTIINTYKKRIDDQERFMEKQNESLAHLKQQYSQARDEVERLRHALNTRTSNINQLESELANQDLTISNLEVNHSAKDRNIQRLQDALKSKDRDIAQLKNALAKKDSTILEYKKRLVEATTPKTSPKIPATSVGTPLVESIKYIREENKTVMTPPPAINEANIQSRSQKQAIEIIGDTTISNNIAHYEALFAKKDRTIALLKSRLADVTAQLDEYSSLPYDVTLTNNVSDPKIALKAVYPSNDITQTQVADARLDAFEHRIKYDEKNRELMTLKSKLSTIRAKLSQIENNIEGKNNSIETLQQDIDQLIQ